LCGVINCLLGVCHCNGFVASREGMQNRYLGVMCCSQTSSDLVYKVENVPNGH
jgi:hypothetical protein